MNRKQVLVALSGGMDSAAVVTLLREAGYEPRALYLDMLDSESERLKAVHTAKRLAVDLTIESVSELFRREIVDHLLSEHTRGVTPAPCSRCNPMIKWSTTASVADRMGIYHIATGHYVRIKEREGHKYFQRGIDPTKDQSYYLWGVPEHIRHRAITPLGGYTKAEIRNRMSLLGYSEIASQRESMGVCFLDGCGYNEFLHRRLNPSQGDVCLWDGRVVGVHDGYELYTIGQRRGYKLLSDWKEQLAGHAVVRIDADTNSLIIGAADQLLSSVLWLENWLLDEMYMAATPLSVMVRGIGRNPQKSACATIENDLLRIDLGTDNSAWAAAKGQPVAIYFEDIVVGGGILLRAE